MRNFDSMPSDVEAMATRCIDCAMQVHRHLGPGFKGLIYHRAFCLELDANGIAYQSELPIMVKYKSWTIPGQKVDLIVGRLVLVEIKAVPKIKRVHQCQVVSYLRTLDMRLGLILNFAAELMKHGIRRVAR